MSIQNQKRCITSLINKPGQKESIVCQTYEEYKKLCWTLDNFGFRWRGGGSYRNTVEKMSEEEVLNAIFDIHSGSYSTLDYAKDYNIVYASDIDFSCVPEWYYK